MCSYAGKVHLRFHIAASALVLAATSVSAQPSRPSILTEDVERFYRIYDAANGHPTASSLQTGYLANQGRCPRKQSLS
jgi:hypothetical protein